MIVSLYTEPPVNGTVLCVDELGPVIPRSYPPVAGWSSDGHRVKSELDYSRGPEKSWVYGALRVRDGHCLTLSSFSRNTAGYLRLLDTIDEANPTGDLYLIADNLSSHKSQPIQEWLAAHERINPVFIPVGASWLNLQEGWWRMYRKEALAGQSFVDSEELELARSVATRNLNSRAKPWVWGCPPRPKRQLRRRFVYRL
jgi:hypothetical protein